MANKSLSRDCPKSDPVSAELRAEPIPDHALIRQQCELTLASPGRRVDIAGPLFDTQKGLFDE